MAAMCILLSAILATCAGLFFSTWLAVRLKGCKISPKKFFLFLEKNY